MLGGDVKPDTLYPRDARARFQDLVIDTYIPASTLQPQLAGSTATSKITGSTPKTMGARLERAVRARNARRYPSTELALIAIRDGTDLPARPPRVGLLEDIYDRLVRVETTLLSERDDLRRRLDYALAELRKRDEMRQQPRRRWFRG